MRSVYMFLSYESSTMSALDSNSKRSWVEIMDLPEEENNIEMKTKDRKEDIDDSSCRKKYKPNKNDSVTTKKPIELETDPLVLQRRQKQIDYGKNTVGYHTYVKKVPIDRRKKQHPRTPDKYKKYSRRSWDALIKLWRIDLHKYDTESLHGGNDCEGSFPPKESSECSSHGEG